MSKPVVTVCLAALMSMAVFPRAAAADVQFGIRIGANAAKLTGADLDDIETTLKTKTGFIGGIFIAFNIGKVLTIQPEALYTMKGATFDYGDLEETYTDKLYANYLEIPLLLKIKIPLPIIQPFVLGGPAIGFKLSEKASSGEEGDSGGEDLFGKSDYGAVVGAGVHFGRSFMIEVRYSTGLQKAIDTLKGDAELDLKNGVMSASIGIAF